MIREPRSLAEHLPWTFIFLSIATIVSWSVRSGHIEPSFAERKHAIQDSFSELVHELAEEGERLVRDSTLYHQLLSGGGAGLESAFGRLTEDYDNQDVGVELLDARGNILAWTGRTWNPTVESVPMSQNAARSARVERVGALVVLRVLVRDRDALWQARLHRPLSVETPGLERLFGVPEFSRQAAEIAGGRVTVLPRSSSMMSTEQVSLVAFERDTVATAALGPGGRESRSPDDLTAALLVLTLLSALAWLWKAASVPQRRSLALLTAAGVWVVRVVIGEIDATSRWLLGDATDPRIYAAPSVGTLSGSPADLFLSTLTLFVSLWWLDRFLDGRQIRVTRAPSRWLWLFATIAVALVTAILSRGFVAAVRSLVVDATIPLYDPSSLWPSLPASVLIASLFFLALTYRTVWIWSVRVWLTWLRTMGMKSWWAAVGGSLALTLVLSALLSQLESFEILSWWVPAAGWLGGITIIAAQERWQLSRIVRWIPHGFAIMVIVLPVLDQQAEWKRWQGAERLLREQIQPGDSWLTFMVASDLRSLSVDPDAVRMLAESEPTSVARSAFRLWSRTLVSQQRSSSGLAVYDDLGRERDRFMSGIGTFDQQAVLRAVFDADEETVQAVDLSVGSDRRMFYGGWTTVRGPDNAVYGSVALVLSASADESIILSTATRSNRLSDMSSVIEYDNGRVIRSLDRGVPEGAALPEVVERRLVQDPRRFVRREDGSLGGGMVYARDLMSPGRTYAVRVEGRDVRWWLFHAIKISFLFALLGVAGAILRPSWRVAAKTWLVSFRGRLFLAFASIALVPLVILAWSNQTISLERTERNQEESLRRDLTLVQQRLSISILGSEDLDRGLDDDFCRAVAADLGIEFSIFRSERLLASSRPELYASGVLDARLPADAFSFVHLGSAGFHLGTERIGDLIYAVGYGAFEVDGRRAGIIAIPTLYRQLGIDEDLAERNAFLLVTAAGVFVLVLIAGGWMAERIAGPVRQMTKATEQLRDGRTQVSVRTDRSDEIGSLMNAFDRMASELDESRRRIAQVEREQAWREMAKQVAHEIKNPLTPIKLSLQHLRQAFKDKAKDRETLVVKVADTVIEQVEALARIATEFSRFARLPERQFTRVDLLASIREASALFGTVPGVEFTLELPGEPAVVVADADELRRVFINLFRNSVQAMEGRGEILVKAEHADRLLRLTVRDSGPGVASESRTRIFEPSFSTKTEGMGLGLAIVRSVIVDLGGSIELDPEGPGATFRIIIPLH